MSTRDKTTDQPHEPAGCELSASAGSPLAALAKSVTENPPDVQEAELLLEALRWKEDMKIFNDFGEHVWLKPLFVRKDTYETVEPEHPLAERIGITDCCLVDDPCVRHRDMANQRLREEFMAERSRLAERESDAVMEANRGRLEDG